MPINSAVKAASELGLSAVSIILLFDFEATTFTASTFLTGFTSLASTFLVTLVEVFFEVAFFFFFFPPLVYTLPF